MPSSEPIRPALPHRLRGLPLRIWRAARFLAWLSVQSLKRRQRADPPVTNPVSADLLAILADRAERVTAATGRPDLGAMFVRLMRNTWETTLRLTPEGTFAITGDIPAMWLRDSSAQMRPFLPLVGDSGEVRAAVRGLIREQWRLIGIDPYANAFNRQPSSLSWGAMDLDPNPWVPDSWVWERKYEVDSLAFPIQLAWQMWRLTGDVDDCVRVGVRRVIELWRTEQQHSQCSDYRFIRCFPAERLGPNGRGTPVGVTGMTWSGFRPSDDPCRYGYNIPAQFFAAHALDMVGELARDAWHDDEIAGAAASLADEIRAGARRHGVTETGVLAYEVDGLGGQLMMDDANMPSLLSLPLTGGLAPDDPLYLATRRWVLSSSNPNFHSGRLLAGVGSPHTPGRRVWPIALAVQGLTSHDAAEKGRLASTLADTTGGTRMMHESVDVDDDAHFSRPWFSWANSMFCELLLDLAGERLP